MYRTGEFRILSHDSYHIDTEGESTLQHVLQARGGACSRMRFSRIGSEVLMRLEVLGARALGDDSGESQYPDSCVLGFVC